MALTETQVLSHDIRGEYKSIDEITDTFIFRDGVQISHSRHRSGHIFPGDLLGEWDGTGNDARTFVRTDVSGMSQDFQDLAGICWTEDRYAAYQAALRAQ